MLFQIRQMLEKKKKMIVRLSFVAVLLVTFSPLLSAMTQGNQANFIEGTNSTLNRSELAAVAEIYYFASFDADIDEVVNDVPGDKKESVVAIATTITTAPHCPTMTYGIDCYHVVCCSSLVFTITPIQVYPKNETHKVFVSISNYLVTLPIEIKPPKRSSV